MNVDGIEWDDGKNAANVAKHGVSFERAVAIFKRPVATAIDNRFDYGEVRWVTIGRLADGMTLVVVHTERNGRARLISARRASRRERQDYDAAIVESANKRGA